ncbi:ABC transporter ATP-binding protein/permease [Dorea formicigenerans]|uniref:ABC transporter ATP-binding protein n=1 Tax=Dorea formicigenerans TaxID=39486 RepID=UPI001D05EC85|nr:ABC transporter ATP-binding protein [Dorea formicigenerans]MCC3184419.1 ABC transporter ATP-binding protein/permease [[Clostridium] innocuum]MCB6282519.1 ABC transporter ATP-binding protein/permease [Dorea formicigenerans]MCB6379889.1 ABC transporter ATP-binding protein/permease [Dorea formicigenerans]MCB6382950.1 ABC transporter ATP-binding protein/permease [Dorea formicigenerans]MCB6388428.1 ABC transporter ATP-binding protein/permease [Dorea formicigenerans]
MPRGRMGGRHGMSTEKAKDFKGTMKKLMGYLAQYKIGLLLVVIFAIGSTIFNIAGPKILGKATTELFHGLISKVSGESGIDFDKIAKILIGLMCLYVCSALFSFIQGYIMTGVSQKLTYRMRKEISEKIDRLPMGYFDKMTHGEILSRITNDVDTLSQSLNQSATQVITSVATIIGVLVMMLSISPLMTVIAILILPLSMGLIGMIVKRSQRYFKEQQEYLGYVNGQVEEVYGGHNIVKAFNKEDDVIDEFDRDNDRLYRSAWKSQFLSGMMMPIMQFVGNLGYVAVVILGGYLAIKKTIEVGDIQSFIQYVRNFTQPIQQVAQVANMLQSTAAASERVFEFLEEPEEEAAPENPVVLKNPEGAVEFEHVHFGYNPEHTIIHDFSVKVEPGQKIAIVGPTGAGKTTMVKLLMRFYDVSGGSIKVDGHDIREFDRGELRRMFGMVLQDTWLFKGSIEDNIRYGKLDAAHEDVVKAADAAYAHRFIQTLPGGYGMELNEEASNVSQGQKQLLTIARAILADPKILILDEATSSVDTRTEVRIQKAMDNLMKGRTSFIIAHRLSTIRDADLILVMKEGDIVEMGRHEELLAKNGFYADLYNSQFEQTA